MSDVYVYDIFRKPDLTISWSKGASYYSHFEPIPYDDDGNDDFEDLEDVIHCEYCRETPDELELCSVCQRVSYCSKKCQENDREIHERHSHKKRKPRVTRKFRLKTKTKIKIDRDKFKLSVLS